MKNIVESIISQMIDNSNMVLDTIDDREEQDMEATQIQFTLYSICDDFDISENGIRQIHIVAKNCGFCVKDIECYLARLQMEGNRYSNKEAEIEIAYGIQESFA